VSAPPIPETRTEALTPIVDRLRRARSVALTTHVNADGDGAGCEIALASWLRAHDVRATIVNPTPFPSTFEFLLATEGAEDDMVADLGAGGETVLDTVELLLVVDTGEIGRIGKVARALTRETIVIDHHPIGEDPIPGSGLRDPEACATGELIYDLLRVWEARTGSEGSWSPALVDALYTAILTDTGSFRFSNTTPRTHEIVADLIGRGADPEKLYSQLYSVPLRRVLLLREALGTLEYDADHGIAWITVPAEALQRLGVGTDDFDGLIDHARGIRGTRVALLFRQTGGGTKISFRATGDIDVNRIARMFGGGGHVKAAGAVVGGPLEANRARVLDAVRSAIGSADRAAERAGRTA